MQNEKFNAWFDSFNTEPTVNKFISNINLKVKKKLEISFKRKSWYEYKQSTGYPWQLKKIESRSVICLCKDCQKIKRCSAHFENLRTRPPIVKMLCYRLNMRKNKFLRKWEHFCDKHIPWSTRLDLAFNYFYFQFQFSIYLVEYFYFIYAGFLNVYIVYIECTFLVIYTVRFTSLFSLPKDQRER